MSPTGRIIPPAFRNLVADTRGAEPGWRHKRRNARARFILPGQDFPVSAVPPPCPHFSDHAGL